MPTEPRQYDSQDVEDQTTLQLLVFRIDQLDKKVDRVLEDHEDRLRCVEKQTAEINVRVGVGSTIASVLGAAAGIVAALLKPGP